MSKISADHLRRQAYVYVRQSTPGQVKNHLESKQLQYALAERATQLGWQAATVIDDDQGRSASGIHRVGFEALLGALCEGTVGAVFCIEPRGWRATAETGTRCWNSAAWSTH